MDNTIRTTVIVTVVGLAVLLWIMRLLRRAILAGKDPFVTVIDAQVTAVDLSSSWVSRHSGDGSDSVRARIVAQPGYGPESPGSHPRQYLSGWDAVSTLPTRIVGQVLTSTVFINQVSPNLRFSDPAKKAEALRQMKQKDNYYRFELPEPVPVRIRESAGGRLDFDYRV